MSIEMLPGLVTAILALGTWMALREWGAPKYRRQAVPISAAILLIGIDVAYELPLYVYVLAFFIAPLLFHRSVKGRLAAAAAKISELPVPRLGSTLKLMPDPNGAHVAVWAAEAAPDAVQPQPIVLTLDFSGETEDDYSVSLWGVSHKFYPVHLVLHHPDAKDTLAGFPKDLAPLAGIPGYKDWGVRCDELDFALSILNQNAAAASTEFFSLRTEEREMYLEVKGGVIRLVSSRTFNEDELRAMLESMALWVQRVRAAFAIYRPPQDN